MRLKKIARRKGRTKVLPVLLQGTEKRKPCFIFSQCDEMRLRVEMMEGDKTMDEINRIVAFAVKKDVELYMDMPLGWKKIVGAMTAPRGSVWICNGESYFSGKRKKALLLTLTCM